MVRLGHPSMLRVGHYIQDEHKSHLFLSFLIAVITKILEKGNSRKEGFISSHSLRVQPTVAGEPRQQDPEVAGLTAAPVRKLRELTSGAQVA